MAVFMPDFKIKNKIIFGAGGDCDDLIKMYPEVLSCAKYMVDNNPELWGKVKSGVPIKSPAELKNENPSNVQIIVAMGAYYNVIPQIKSEGKFAMFFFHSKVWLNPFDTVVLDYKNVLLRIETTSHCNLDCSFCNHGNMKRSKGNMEQELFEKIVMEAGKLGFKKLDIRNFGEPLLDKQLAERIRFAKNNAFNDILLYTNAILLSQSKYNELADAGLDRISISLSPQKEYDATRTAVSYSKIIEILKTLERKSKPKITIHIVSPESTDVEISETVSLLNKMGYADVLRMHIHNWGVDSMSQNLQKTTPCFRIWNSLTVLWDGRVSLCCIDYEGDYILGDLRKQNLSEVFNSKKYVNIRQQQLDGDLPQICIACTNFR